MEKEDKGLQKGITTTSVLPFCSNLSLAKINEATIMFAKQEEANRRWCWTFPGEEEKVLEEED